MFSWVSSISKISLFLLSTMLWSGCWPYTTALGYLVWRTQNKSHSLHFCTEWAAEKKKTAASFGGKIQQEWGGVPSAESWFGTLQAYLYIGKRGFNVNDVPFYYVNKILLFLYLYHAHPSLKTHLKIPEGYTPTWKVSLDENVTYEQP